MSYKRFKKAANLIFKYSTVPCSDQLPLQTRRTTSEEPQDLQRASQCNRSTGALEVDEGYKTTAVLCILCLIQPSIQVSLRYKSNDQQQQLSVDFSLSSDQCTFDELHVVAFWIIAHKHQLNSSIPFLCITSLLGNMGKATTM